MLALAITILTLTPGSDLFARFGHTAILVEDGERRTVYNYGTYDGGDPAIVSQFLAGEIPYYLSAGDYDGFLRHYGARTITGQRLALDAAAARRVADFLEWNLRPENTKYRYDWFRNNCTTKTRDAVDLALGGGWRVQAATSPSGTTLREILRRALSTLPSVYLMFSVGLNARVDEPLSRWDAMAMPDELMEGLRAARRLDGRALVAEEWIWRGPLPRAKVEPRWLVPSLAALLLILIAFTRVGVALWSLAAGFLGLWMLVWMFLPYGDAKWSANLIAYSPLWLSLLASRRSSLAARMRAWRTIEIIFALTLLELVIHIFAGRQAHLGFTAYALAATALSWLAFADLRSKRRARN